MADCSQQENTVVTEEIGSSSWWQYMLERICLVVWKVYIVNQLNFLSECILVISVLI